MNTMRGWVLAAVAMTGLGCGDNREKATVDAAPDTGGGQSPVERGQYIMNVLGACTFCHTPLLPNGERDTTRLLAGVNCFFDLDPTMDNFGCLSTRNLTNHATGLANATDAQIKNAFQNGIRIDGKPMSPVMPYWIFHNMTDEDADAVVAYLRTVPGVDHAVPPNEQPWASYNDGTIPQIPFVVPDRDIPMPRGGVNNASAMRGRYLSSMAGLCMDCHTPETAPFTLELDFTRAYGGGRVFPKEALGLIDPSFPALVMTRNLTPHATGLSGWTREQIRTAIYDGADPDGNQVCAATHGKQISPYAALLPQDLDDIVEYIYNLPEVDNDTTGCTEVGCGDCAGPPVP